MGRPAHEHRDRLVAEFRRSGLPQVALAQNDGGPVGTLWGWLYRAAALQPTVQMLPVKVAADTGPSSAGVMEALLPSGVGLWFTADIDPGYVRQLVADGWSADAASASFGVFDGRRARGRNRRRRIAEAMKLVEGLD